MWSRCKWQSEVPPSDLRKWHAQSQMLLVSASLMQSPLMFIQLQG